MRVGMLYFLRNPSRDGWFRPWSDYYAASLEHMAEMDRLGFEVISFAEHHCDPDGYNPATTVAMTAAAMRTTRARIGTNILQTPYYHPVLLAEQLAVIDILSGGRLEIAFAPGAGFAAEHKMFGTRVEDRYSRHTEGVELVRRCWTEDAPFSHHGRHWQLEDVWINPKPLQRPHPPIFVTTWTERAMNRAARLGYNSVARGGGFFDGVADPLEWQDFHSQWTAALARMGHAPSDREVSLWATCYITEDPERAWAEYGETITYTSGYTRQGIQPYGRRHRSLTADSQRVFVTPDQAIAQMEEAYGGVAPDELLIVACSPGMPIEKSVEFHANFAKSVLPRVAHLGQAAA